MLLDRILSDNHAYLNVKEKMKRCIQVCIYTIHIQGLHWHSCYSKLCVAVFPICSVLMYKALGGLMLLYAYWLSMGILLTAVPCVEYV